MLNLIKAELYKTIKKKSFVTTILLIIFVSIIYTILVNKNLKNSYENSVIPLMSKEEYSSIYKGDYNEYVSKYKGYIKISNLEQSIKQKEISNKGITLLENSYSLFFLVGIIILFISFNSLSYDFNHGTIKYLFISVSNKKALILSKIISQILITIGILFIALITVLITSSLLTNQNLLLVSKEIIVNNSIHSVNISLYFVYKLFLYTIPIFFIIVLTLFLTILFKGSALAVIISLIIYMFSLTLTNLALSYNISFVRISFLPYLDYTYFEESSNVTLLNSLYNTNFSYQNSVIILSMYAIVFLMLSFKLLKRDL